MKRYKYMICEDLSLQYQTTLWKLIQMFLMVKVHETYSSRIFVIFIMVENPNIEKNYSRYIGRLQSFSCVSLSAAIYLDLSFSVLCIIPFPVSL